MSKTKLHNCHFIQTPPQEKISNLNHLVTRPRPSMVRDRLLELQMTSSSTRSSDLSLPATTTEKNMVMEAFLTPYADIRIQLAQISTNLETMKRLIQTISIRDKNQEEMNNLRIQNVRLGNLLMSKFQTLKANLPLEDDYSLEARMKRTLFYGLHQNYVILWNKNEEFLLLHEKNLRTNLRLHTKLINQDATKEELDALIKNNTTNLFVGNILEETEKERRTLRDLMDRLDELKRLEKSIEEVHALFIRIQNLVMEQNEIIQRVEFHAEQATQFAGKGKNELVKAETLRKKAIKKKIILIVVLTILLILFLLVCVFT